ncbi:addiction module protein [Urbifossiella limnaea]|uniref:Addiction module component n=1 Tax=Urbifossiella limnaea TaxID=2528023 RepID=A0A517Y0P4_9BACT|nr:addiction module protein [Urbifossiella limnaea]QDU23323.1 Putative addiction module component [Urbifossiella limnaea]
MSPSIYDLGIDKLSVPDRLRLIGEIWDTLEPPAAVAETDELRDLIDARLDAADANPGVGSTWDEVKARIQGRR